MKKKIIIYLLKLENWIIRVLEYCQRGIQSSVKQLKWYFLRLSFCKNGYRISAVNYFRKKFHLICLTGYTPRVINAPLIIINFEHISHLGVSAVDFEQVSAGWLKRQYVQIQQEIRAPWNLCAEIKLTNSFEWWIWKSNKNKKNHWLEGSLNKLLRD